MFQLVNDAEPVLPVVTLIPAGLEVTRALRRPVTVTVSVAPSVTFCMQSGQTRKPYGMAGDI
jgi:hypothetical protein